MSPEEHYEQAEKLLERVTRDDGVVFDNPPAMALIRAAHVHALLATAKITDFDQRGLPF